MFFRAGLCQDLRHVSVTSGDLSKLNVSSRVAALLEQYTSRNNSVPIPIFRACYIFFFSITGDLYNVLTINCGEHSMLLHFI